MRLLKKSFIVLLIVAFLFELQTGSFAWLTRPLRASMPSDFGGSTEVLFFESGDGSPETPYVISAPVHLYNLAWLQYLGYFNLGVNINNNRAQNYFTLKNNIDMNGLAIPPIGTEEYPFLGNFNGQGFTILNGITANAMDLMPHRPSAAKFRVNDLISAYASSNNDVAQIIGFFGVLGDFNDALSSVISRMNASTLGTISANEISSGYFYLNNHSVKTKSSNTTIGIAAGYVNAELVAVGVCESSLDVTSSGTTELTSNKSDFTLVGYATNNAKTTLNVRTVKLTVPKTATEEWVYEGDAGSDTAWGGSVDMIAMYNRLQYFVDRSTTNSSYVYDRYTEVGVNGQTKVNNEASGRMYTRASDPLQGSFVFSQPQGRYTYLHGGTTIFETKYELGDDTTAYLISSSNENYISVNGTSITSTSNANLAAKWFFSNGIDGGYISTLTNGFMHYLNNNNGTLTLTQSKNTMWRNSNGVIYSEGYYLNYNSTAWQLSQYPGFKISNGNGNYLTLSYNGGITNTNNSNSAVTWTLSSVSGGWRISAQASNNNTYYLRYSNGLKTTTDQSSATSWTLNNGEIYYNGNFIRYSNGWGTSTMTFYISDGNGNYLTLSYNGGITNTNNSNSAVTWTLSSVSGGWRISAQASNNNTYYLLYSNGLTTTTNQRLATSWTLNNGRLSVGDNYLKFINDVSNGYWDASFGLIYANLSILPTIEHVSLHFSVTPSTLTQTTEKEVVEKVRVYVDTTGTNITYFPLQVNETNNDYRVVEKNTGYIISSSQDRTTTSTYPAKSGDIRVSYYDRDSISSNYIKNNKVDKVLTVNDYGNSVEITNLNAYEKLSKSKTSFEEILSKNTSSLYGLHFMDAHVNIENLITVPTAIVNDTTYTNYQMPTDCIDFRLKEKGYINFFAGTYFPSNNSFFSLYDIFRDENHNIIDIKRIVEIYGDDSHKNYSYVYKYEDGSYSKAYQIVNNEKIPISYPEYLDMPQGYSIKFKTSWIEANDITTNALYYFEIPVNDGEYALGSTPGGTGSYLMYLDIGANAQTVERTIISETITTITNTHSYANGIGVVPNSQAQNGYIITKSDIISYKLPTNYLGTLQIYRIGSEISIVSGISGTTRYIAEGLTVNGSSIPIPDLSVTRVEKRLTYIDYNVVTDETIITVISQIDNNAPTMIVYLPNGTTRTTPYRNTSIHTDSVEDLEDYYQPSSETLLEFSFTVHDGAQVDIEYEAEYKGAQGYIITSLSRKMLITSSENTTAKIITENYIEDSGTDPNRLSSTEVTISINGN